MAPRLLSLLTDIENALVQQGSPAVSQPGKRSVSFHKGLARIIFCDGSGSIMLQNFTLADGQICVRAFFATADGTEIGSHAVYPREIFDWAGAAEQFATAWLAAQERFRQAAKMAPEEAASSLEPIAATG